MHITIESKKHAQLNIIFDFNDATLFDADFKKKEKKTVQRICLALQDIWYCKHTSPFIAKSILSNKWAGYLEHQTH